MIDHTASRNTLFEQADRAIADAFETREKVRAGLAAAGQRRPYRPSADDVSGVPPLAPLPPDGFLEPWWSVARTLAATGEAVRAANVQLERAWWEHGASIGTMSAPCRR